MILIGDVHGLYYDWKAIVKKHEQTIQLGDFGFGFSKRNDDKVREFLKMYERNKYHLFLRGNHDDPAVCRSMPNYLGDYGTFEYKGQTVFYLGGGDSIDKHMRLPGISWWEDEQLSMTQLQNAIDLYCVKNPDIVLTHEPPESIKQSMSMFREKFKSRTGQALQGMLEKHPPKLWVFAHMHVSWDETHKTYGTRAVGLDELQEFDLDKAIREMK